MNLISEETMQEILAHYPEKHHALIRHQLEAISKIISDYGPEYQSDKGFQKAIDMMFERFINGTFILLENEE
jgi:hypothetical protein